MKMKGVLVEPVKFNELSSQHIRALIDLRNAELTRLNRDRFTLIKELDELELELHRRTNAA